MSYGNVKVSSQALEVVLEVVDRFKDEPGTVTSHARDSMSRTGLESALIKYINGKNLLCMSKGVLQRFVIMKSEVLTEPHDRPCLHAHNNIPCPDWFEWQRAIVTSLPNTFFMGRYLVLILPLVLLQCHNPQSELDQKHLEIMALHDDVMPMMADLNRARRTLADGLGQRDSVEAHEVRRAINMIKAAEDGMWEWMAGYQKPDQWDDSTRQYMENQKVAVDKVNRDMKSSWENAQKWLK